MPSFTPLLKVRCQLPPLQVVQGHMAKVVELMKQHETTRWTSHVRGLSAQLKLTLNYFLSTFCLPVLFFLILTICFLVDPALPAATHLPEARLERHIPLLGPKRRVPPQAS